MGREITRGTVIDARCIDADRFNAPLFDEKLGGFGDNPGK